MQNFSIPAKTAGITSIILALLIPFCTSAYSVQNDLDYDIFLFENKLTVDFDFAGLFPPDLVNSIKKGFPLHIDFKVELKKSVPIWFDPTLDRHQAFINVEYQSFGARYSLNVLDFTGELHRQTYKQLENMIAGMNEFLILDCDSVRKFDPYQNLYFNFALELRRLTADEIGHAGDWYRGKSPDKADTSRKLPESHENILDQLLDITGMGPTKYHYSSYIFKPSELKEVRP